MLPALTLSAPLPGRALIEAYLEQFGIPAGLPELSVKYGTTEVHAQEFVKPRDNALLHVMPEVTWDMPAGAKAMVLFIDLDGLGRPEDPKRAGRMGPYVHSMWTDCTANRLSLEACHVVKPYLAPGNNRPRTNRYTWILFNQADLTVQINQKAPGLMRFGRSFDLRALLQANPSMRAISYNVAMVGGDGNPKPKKAKKPRLREQ